MAAGLGRDHRGEYRHDDRQRDGGDKPLRSGRPHVVLPSPRPPPHAVSRRRSAEFRYRDVTFWTAFATRYKQWLARLVRAVIARRPGLGRLACLDEASGHLAKLDAHGSSRSSRTARLRARRLLRWPQPKRRRSGINRCGSCLDSVAYGHSMMKSRLVVGVAELWSRSGHPEDPQVFSDDPMGGIEGRVEVVSRVKQAAVQFVEGASRDLDGKLGWHGRR